MVPLNVMDVTWTLKQRSTYQYKGLSVFSSSQSPKATNQLSRKVSRASRLRQNKPDPRHLKMVDKLRIVVLLI